MDSKTLTTVLIVIICVLLFPFLIGAIGGIVGLIGGIIGAVFGAIGGVIGAFFGLIAGIFGAIFGIFSWIFDGDFYWDGPFHIFGSDVFTVIVLVIIAVLISRSRVARRAK
jgi:hypothetical protein